MLAALVIANVGTMCAEFAGVAASLELLAGISRYATVPLAGIGVSALVLRGSFHRVEHVLLAAERGLRHLHRLGSARAPGLGRGGEGPGRPAPAATREAVLVAVATIGTTLAPWGLVFIQSYAADKHLRLKDLRFENVDVVVGALLTGVIGLFVVVACAATLHVNGIDINDAKDAAKALEPLAGGSASTLFGVGFLGAALLAAAVVPLSTAYSVAETVGKPADVDDTFSEAPLFYLSFGAVVLIAAVLVLIPGAPLIQILFLSQALNAVLLLVMLPVHAAAGRGSGADGRRGARDQRADRHRSRAGADRGVGDRARRADDPGVLGGAAGDRRRRGLLGGVPGARVAARA